jgi:phenylacetate-coenzyme A ligase PaaK-like adenylate-forming protein
LTKKTVVNRNLDLLVSGTLPEYVRWTGGTTVAKSKLEPLRRFQTEEERAWWMRLHSSLATEFQGIRPIAARIVSMEHGLDFPGALPGVFPVPLEKPSHFYALTRLLRQSFSLPGVSSRVQILSGSLTALKPLTILCMENGIETHEFELKEVMSFGWYLTRRWRDLLESYWRVRVGEMYGVSEIPGLHALRCQECGYYHFSPLSIVEVLSLDSEKPITIGIGRVVASALYPLCQAQPMIRYDTQDIIEVHELDCPSGEGIGFTFLGRESKIVMRTGRDGKPEVLLTPTAVSEVLDEFPDVAIEPHFRVETLRMKTSFGWQKFAVSRYGSESGKTEIHLNLELRWPWMQYPSAAENLSEEIKKRLKRDCPVLRDALEEKTVELKVQFEDPGATDYAELV